jgi:predicted transcriptional regulator
MGFSRITFIKQTKPSTRNINEELQWFGSSLGLFNLRDKDKSCFRIFIVLVKQVNIEKHLSSDEIAKNLNLSRGTVIHHLNKLMDSGLVVNEKGKYVLRVDTMQELVGNMRKNSSSFLDELEQVAKEIDKRLEL